MSRLPYPSATSVHTAPSRNGERYEGEWQDGLRHGYGRRYACDGTQTEGRWERDKRHGETKVTAPHGAYRLRLRKIGHAL